MLRFWSSLLLAAACAHAHAVSVSYGELHIRGLTANYELRLPAYEAEHRPGAGLLDEIHFTGARRISGECTPDGEWVVCRAAYQFESEVEAGLEVECTLYRATVPNHIHLLYVSNGALSNQRTFDQSADKAYVPLVREPAWQAAARNAGSGFLRVSQSISALLFLAVVGFSVRHRWEVLALTGVMIVAELAARPLAPVFPVALSPRFLEATIALLAAYLAAELLWMPESRARWAIVPLTGFVHGLPFTPYDTSFLAGATLAQLAAIGGAGALFACAPFGWRRYVNIGLLAASAAWFASFLLG